MDGQDTTKVADGLTTCIHRSVPSLSDSSEDLSDEITIADSTEFLASDGQHIIVPVLFYVKALFDYKPTLDEEMKFEAGDVIAVISRPEDGWWKGVLLDESHRVPGRLTFPMNFISAPLSKSELRSILDSSKEIKDVDITEMVDIRTTEQPTALHTHENHPILFYVVALYDYKATTDTEFDFMARDVIEVTAKSDDGWWTGVLMNKARRVPGRTVFPSNYVARLDDDLAMDVGRLYDDVSMNARIHGFQMCGLSIASTGCICF